jgi:hypothetical protein
MLEMCPLLTPSPIAYCLRVKQVQFLNAAEPNMTSGRPVNRTLSLKRDTPELGIINSPICGMCHMERERTSHILCECVALAEVRFCLLGKHFVEQSDKILLCRMLFFVRGIGLLVE